MGFNPKAWTFDANRDQTVRPQARQVSSQGVTVNQNCKRLKHEDYAGHTWIDYSGPFPRPS